MKEAKANTNNTYEQRRSAVDRLQFSAPSSIVAHLAQNGGEAAVDVIDFGALGVEKWRRRRATTVVLEERVRREQICKQRRLLETR